MRLFPVFLACSLGVPLVTIVGCGSSDSAPEAAPVGAPDDGSAPDATQAADGGSVADAPAIEDSAADTKTTVNDASVGETDAGNAGDANDGALGVVPVKLTSGERHSCALMSDATVRCWGANLAGQLGFPADTLAHPLPVEVPGLTGVADIAAGGRFNCARLLTGTVQCWGDNGTNQLGHTGAPDTACVTNNGSACNPVPTDVPGLANVTELAPGYQHACALTAGGMLCWGDNIGGQLGHAKGADPLCGGSCTATPTLLNPAVAGITDMGTGLQVSFAIVGGTVMGFGSTGGGLLGGPAGGPTPTSNGATNALRLATGALSDHSCATQTGNAATCWGEDNYGVVTLAASFGTSAGPTKVPVLSVAAIGVGTFVTCVLQTGGAVLCWGINDGGQLGHDPATDPVVSMNPASIVPTTVAGADGVQQLSVGSQHVCVLSSGGTVKCWGWGDKGQNGNATSQNTHVPTTLSFAAADGG